MTKFLQTIEEGLVSENYIISIHIRPHNLPDCYIEFAVGTHSKQCTATPDAVEQFLSTRG